MASKHLFLICNAHLDPVWLWTWPEGLAETLATFRTAADLCDEFEDFIFCHNEALLYRWVEIHDSELFERIQNLVKRGRWHIMGGWFLQPDCNMPCGESFVRQVLAGKSWVFEKFGVEPRTAVNFDPFGHTRGLVQILKKSGFDSYLFCRPGPDALELPDEDFIWVGYDGSEIAAHRAPEHYNSERGQARSRTEKWLETYPDRENGLLLWGIGDHGGGASREDLRDLRGLIETCAARTILHDIPERYFEARAGEGRARPRVARDLNPWAVGCYTSMARIKQRHRALESRFSAAEKISTHAAFAAGIDYPRDKLKTALEDLLFVQFHDILPGSSIAEVEDQALQRMDHGLEILDRVQTRAFFALTAGQRAAAEGEFPILVYNPHPFAVTETLVCEFQPPEPGRDPGVWRRPALIAENGAPVLHQPEKEACNIAVDQRKRIVFRTELPAGRMSRFSCRLESSSEFPPPARPIGRSLSIGSDSAEFEIDFRTGRLRRFRAGGADILLPEAPRLLVVRDDPDPWGMRVKGFRDVVDEFRLKTVQESAVFAGVDSLSLPPLRVIEEGPVRTVVEALLTCGSSSACLRYLIPRAGAEIEIELRVYWNEKDRMLKLALPTPFSNGLCLGQTGYGVEEFAPGQEERMAQKWLAVAARDGTSALTVINDGTHGFDFCDGELRLSLLRSPGYAAHPTRDLIPIMRQDRFEPRIDQGERVFRFWLQGGPAQGRLSEIEREAQVKHEPPLALCLHPSGKGRKPVPLVRLIGDAVVLSACKMAEAGNRLVLRLFNPTENKRPVELTVPLLKGRWTGDLGPFEIKTLCLNPGTGGMEETDLLEKTSNAAKS